MTPALHTVASLKLANGEAHRRDRDLPEEVPVALVYDGSTQAVMMASPTDLEAFALGFSLSEGLVDGRADIRELDIVHHDRGIELRMWLGPGLGARLAERRRHIVGPTGCGLCGVDSLAAAAPELPQAPVGGRFDIGDVVAALAALTPAQELNRRTHAVHAAGYWTKAEGLVAIAEDVGRHNALDKLIGKLAAADIDTSAGLLLLTSRVSIEMVQKAVRAGFAVIVAVSAPTHRAFEIADKAGLTLIAVARRDGFEIFTHAERIRLASTPEQSTTKAADHAA